MDFLLTVSRNDIEKARQLLQTGIDVNCPILWNAKNTYSPVIPADITSRPDLLAKLQSDQEYHSRPLNIAVLGGHVDMVRLLLSAGADINMKDGRGRTALICAIYGLDLDASNINTSNLNLISQTHDAHFSIMKNVLLRHPNLYVATLDSPQYEIKGITPLCLASYLGKSEIIQLLLEDGRVDVDGTDSKNASALMYAARDGNLPIVQMLLSYDASPDITDSHGWSAIQYAENNPDIVQSCEEALRRKRPDISTIHAPINPVARYPVSYTKLSTLISSLPQYQSSLSHLEFDTLEDVDLMDPVAAPIIQLVQTAFLHSIKSHDHISLQTLLLWSPPLRHDNRSSGVLLINYHDSKTGLTAIHHAMRAKPLPSLDTLAMLYQAGADINAQTYYGRTALHHLARIGVDKDGKSWGIQKSATKAAATQQQRPHNPRLRANSSSSSTQPSMPTHFEETEDTSTAIHTSTYSQQSSATTPVSPSFENRLSTVSAMSARSANSDTTSRTSMVDVSQDPITQSVLAAPTVPAHLGLCASLLIHFGALVNIADPTGNTPLHFAAEFGAVSEVLEVLIMDGNADLHLKNKKQQTPLDICKTEEIRKSMLAWEHERKTSSRTKSRVSYTSNNGNIKPFDTASDYRHSLTRSISRSTIQSATLHGDFRSSNGGKWGGNMAAATATSPPSIFLPTSISEAAANRNKELKKKGDVLDQIDADFEKILNAFFSYQTTFTDSIEKALAYITETILQSWQSDKADGADDEDIVSTPTTVAPSASPDSMAYLERTIVQLRFELREAHDMFDQTDQRAEKVMLHYREELEQVEQIHQADCDLLDLQQDKVEKLFDVFERIDSRFCQLEVDQDELIGQVENWQKLASRHLQHLEEQGQQDYSDWNIGETDLQSCVTNLVQALVILMTIPTNDPVLYLREDRSRLCRDLSQVIQKVLQVPATDCLSNERATLEEKWQQVDQILTKPAPTSASHDERTVEEHMTASTTTTSKTIDDTFSNAKPATHWQRQLLTASLYSVSQKTTKPQQGYCSLNELELSFDILSTNLSEIEKDMDDLNNQSNQVMEGKKRMYDVCLALEKELEALQNDQSKSISADRSETVVRRELDQVMQCTKVLFDRQSILDQEATILKKEHVSIEKQLDDTKEALRQVRPPLLLQGLLERLETEEGPMIRVEKDWQEDASLVATFMDEDDSYVNGGDGLIVDSGYTPPSSYSSCSSGNDTKVGTTSSSSSAMSLRMKKTFPTPLSTQCLISRMDASLYCLKVLAAHHISRSRQSLLEVQASLTQASEEVDEARNQMTTLYGDAAEVARQVYVFKTEVEMIIRHRKEEVVKVWEVVDEVSVGIDTNAAAQQHQQEREQKQQAQSTTKESHHLTDRHHYQQQQAPASSVTRAAEGETDDQDRHQWILRELERFQIVHENLQDAIEELKREQADIGQRIRHVATSLIEPQVDRLVGQSERSLLSISDCLAELMDGIRIHDLGLNLDEKDTGSTMISTSSNGTSPARFSRLTSLSNSTTHKSPPSSPSTPHHRLSIVSGRSASTAAGLGGTAVANNNKRSSLAMSIRTSDRKRMSVMSTSSLSSLSSYQQERMLSRASNLSQVLSKHRSSSQYH
ncbi:hypothetical protein BCR42DRAFT_383606 [Absidia repens]|uniref:Uncharacterized protein n=1 Tax=Absidia repens TaxID=90262 RepID=A0A1X2I0W7_9FUNG|nr:hypothetical protein BCR42DRAFT_383606 [Absidia repens]